MRRADAAQWIVAAGQALRLPPRWWVSLMRAAKVGPRLLAARARVIAHEVKTRPFAADERGVRVLCLLALRMSRMVVT